MTLWSGPTPGGLLAAATGGASAESPWSLAAAVAALVAGTTLFDADTAPAASVALSAGMLGALAAALLLHASPVGAATLLAAALPVVWATRRDDGPDVAGGRGDAA